MRLGHTRAGENLFCLRLITGQGRNEAQGRSGEVGPNKSNKLFRRDNEKVKKIKECR